MTNYNPFTDYYEQIIKLNKLGPQSRVKFKNDSAVYTIKNINPNRRSLFVTLTGHDVYSKSIKSLVQVGNNPIKLPPLNEIKINNPKYDIRINRFDDAKQYYKPGTDILHRIGGPAIERLNGDKMWFQNGELHRLDGPAVEEWNKKEWYINGKEYSEQRFNQITNKLNEDIKYKRMLARGTEHAVYPTKNDQGVIKIPIKNSDGLNRQQAIKRIKNDYRLKAFIEYPEYFPRIIKLGTIYTVLEKLDTKTFINENQRFEKYLDDFYENNSNKITFFYDTYLLSKYQTLEETLAELQTLPNYYEISPEKVNKMLGWANKVITLMYNITDKVKVREYDFHSHNFGYDKDGNLKCLDF